MIFEIGDIVEGISGTRYLTTKTGWRGKVSKIGTEYFTAIDVQDETPYINLKYQYFKKINSVSEEKKSFMSNIIQKVKDLALTPTDRILRNNSLEDSYGEMTPDSRQMMTDELLQERWLSRREKVATDIKSIEDSEK